MSAVERLEPIETRRLKLVPYGPEHAAAAFALLDDWDIARMLAELPWPLTRKHVDDYAAHVASGEGESDSFAVLAESGLVGGASVKRPGTGNPPRVMPRLGYWVGRRFCGQGYATEAVSAVVAYGFHRYAAERIGAGVFADNPASQRVLEKLGFAEVRRDETPCLARRTSVVTIDMHLSRADREGRR
jgi:[ribosomal protein S5]-alanine N-acetyltransferase